MTFAFEAKPERKKSAAPASNHLAGPAPQLEANLGAPAGMPLFLQSLAPHVRTKVAVSPPGDTHEQQANHVAEHVMRMPKPSVSDAPTLQTKSADSGQLPQAGAPSNVAEVLRSPGQRLDTSTRGFLEPRFGHDFTDVRVHNDETAADSVEGLNAQAYTAGTHIVFGHGQYAPSSEPGLRLLAHELTHVVQQQGGANSQPVTRAPRGSIQRKGKPTAPAEVDPRSLLAQNADRLRSEALPAFQRGLDGVDPGVVEEAGSLVLLLWATIEGAHAALRPPEGPDLPEFVEIRQTVLAAVTIQKFRGEDVAGPPRTIEHIGDVGQYIANQKGEAAATVKDAKALLLLLGKSRLEYEDEEAAVRIFRDRPNPWQLGYLRAVVRGDGLARVLETFAIDNRNDLDAIFASQKFTLERRLLGPADRIGVLEPMPAERKVRVLRPYGARELAEELYGRPSFYETVLLPYNRGVLAHLRPESLVRAGTELAVEPQLLWGRYRIVFMAVELTKPQIDRPYIEASVPGAAIAGTKVRYTLRWPVPPPPDTIELQVGDVAQAVEVQAQSPAPAWRTNTGMVLWWPATSMWHFALLDWALENDPSQGGGEELIHSEWVTMERLTKEGFSIDRSWPKLGTYTIRCRVRFGEGSAETELELRYTQAVVTEEEKVEIESPLVHDPRAQLHLRSAETYGEFQRIAAELGVTEDELAANPSLAGPFGSSLGMSYYPEFLLRDLRKQWDETNDEHRRKKITWQIDELESAIRRTKFWGMRNIRSLYVASAGEQTISTPMRLYVAPDPEAAGPLGYSLRLWDFTSEGQPREYTDGHGAWTWTMSLHGLLEAFADQAPYPTGTVRLWLDSSVLPDDVLRDQFISREVLDLHTHGGPWYEKAAGGIMTAAVVIVGSALLGPEVAMTAFAIYGAVMGLADIISRLAEGTFEWDIQTGMDILAIAGGLAAGISPVISMVRGVGQVAWLGTAMRAAGVLQLGVMVGTHLNHIVKAVASGDWDKILEAVTSALADGALLVVTHAQAKAEAAEARARAVADPVFEGARGGRLLQQGEPGGEAGGRPSTAAGIGGERPPGPPPGQEPPATERKGTPRQVHEQWAENLAQTGLSPRPGPGEPAGPPVKAGAYETVHGARAFETPEAAFQAYDEALARAGGREVGIYRNANSPNGEYVVRVGDEHSVSPPEHGNWESVLHRHPNPQNVLTRRMPAPQDVSNTLLSAFRARRPVTEFIDYPLPDGRRGLVAYTVEPAHGRVTIKYEAADRSQVVRTFDSIEAYASHYSERTTYVDPKSPEYKWMMRDLDDFYSNRTPSGEATAAGVLKPGAVPKGEPAAADVSKPEGAPKGEEAAPRSEPAIKRPAKGRAAKPYAPVVRARAQLDRATQGLAQRIETLKQHPDSREMADALDVIRKQLSEGREADASSGITALERRVARAQLTLSSGSLEQLYGEPAEVLGSRVIEYVPVAGDPAPVTLDPTAPSALDATGQKLLEHVRRAVAQFDPSMFTEAERLALKDVKPSRRRAMREMYRGTHIDMLAKKAVLEDGSLEHVLVTLQGEYGADFYDSRTGHWYDITTMGEWQEHRVKYGPDVPNRATVPGFRLPTETE